MKDMYLDYEKNHRRPRSKKTLLITILLVLAAVGVGFGSYRIAIYYFDVMDEQKQSAVVPYEHVSAAENAQGVSEKDVMGPDTEEPDESEDILLDATGVYGMWQVTETAAKVNPDYVIDEEVWMKDFVDERQRTEVHGIYVATAFLANKMDYVLNLADTTEVNAMIIDIKESKGYIAYRMDLPTAKEIGSLTSTVKDMPALVKTLKEHGMYLIARVVCMEDPILAKGRPDLALYKKDGTPYKDSSGLAWVNPYREEVWDYIRDISLKCVELGFDEINYDYVRFPTDNGAADIDYGVDTDENPKVDAIIGGIKRMCEILKPLGVFVSCDVYGSIIASSVDAKLVGQNYFRMAQYLDYICPMIYPSHYANGYYDLDIPDTHPYELIYYSLMNSKRVLYMIDDIGNKAIVRPWLQDFTAGWVKGHLNYGPEEVRAEINGVYDSGHNEWLLWNAAINYNDGALLPKETVEQ